MGALPKARQRRIQARAMELATLKDLRQAARQTQEQLAATLGVGQDTISRLERRSDMLLSTLRHYVESMGGRLELVAQFPNRPPMVIEHLGGPTAGRLQADSARSLARKAD
jgi:transcriptional regulator with XRE-family HTH domain